mmetsp:Transcript_8585/g.18327  ORF Transcript_8585/g.18327 Transcript_8585/m.18327 type:complete len:589 (-) Transcript_8585:181-1947(-)
MFKSYYLARAATAALLLLQLLEPCHGNAGAHKRSGGGNFLGVASAEAAGNTTVTIQEVESTLRASLDAVLGGGGGDAVLRRTAAIEASIWRSFQALPKNSAGRLSSKSVRHLVHGYFAKEHGWLIKGLEPNALKFTPNSSELHEASILRDKAPGLVEKILEDREQGRGLSLEEVVAMTAALERLIFDESMALLQASYELNTLSPWDDLTEIDLHEVLTSYLVVFEMGARGNLYDKKSHRLIKDRIIRGGAQWEVLKGFEGDAVQNYDFAQRDRVNPFGPRRYSFGEATRIMETMAQDYGKFQNAECVSMKERLMDLDADGDGRLSLSTFYSSNNLGNVQFTESVEYLRQTGILDESGSTPRVIIANYITGPSNCIASSDYYSVCCLSECEAVLSELEGRVKGPTVPAAELLAMVGNISSPTVDAPRQLPSVLAAKLSAVADRHAGEVPLHGRLFAQWLHYAFPRECPFPHKTGIAASMTPSEYGDRYIATDEEMKRHAATVNASDIPAEVRKEEMEWMSQWSSEEELMADYNGSSLRAPWESSSLAFRAAVLFVVVALIGVAGLSWKSSSGADVCLLPTYGTSKSHFV